MAQVAVNPLPRAAPPPTLDARPRIVPPEESDARLMIRSAEPRPIVLETGEKDATADGQIKGVEGGIADGVPKPTTFARLDPADASAWKCAWMPASSVSDSTGNTGLRFEIELRAWGRLEIGCAPLHPRGWHVSIASDNAAVRRRLRGELGRLGNALRQLAGHDDMTLEIDA